MAFTKDLYWDERIISAFSSRRNVYRQRAIGGRSETGAAVVQLVNTDGGLDDWATDYSFAGRDAVVWMGSDDPGVTFADLLEDPSKRRNYLIQLTAWEKANDATTTVRLSSQGYRPKATETPAGYGEVFRGVVSDEPIVGLNTASLTLKDKQHLLDVSPYRPIYGGGEDGINFTATGKATGAATEMDITGDMAVMIRVRADALGNHFLFGWDGGTQAPWRFSLRSNGQLWMRYSYSAGTFSQEASTSTSMYAAGVWYAIGYRVTGDQLHFFSRNLESGQKSITWDGPHTVDGTRDAAAGSTFSIANANFAGYVSEARVYDGAGGTGGADSLPDWKRQIEQRIWPGDIKTTDVLETSKGSLVGYWKCDEGTGTTLTDTSASGNNLTLAGSYSWDFPLKGGDDIAGKELPLVFGQFLHFEPLLIDATKLIFQLHPRLIGSVTELLENGGVITADTQGGSWTNGGEGNTNNAPDLATFLSTAPTSSTYTVFLTYGLIRLGSSPSGAIRASGTGDASGSYVSTAADIIERLVVDFGPLSASDIDSTSFTAFDSTTASAVNGLAIPAGDQSSLAQHVDHLLVGARGWWIFNRSDGEMELGQFTDPKTDAGTPTKIEAYHIQRDGVTPERLAPPSRRQKVGYARTWDPLQRDAIIGTVAAGRIDELSEAYRWISIEEDTVAEHYLSAEEPPELGTTLVNRSDAFSEAVARQQLYGTGERRMFLLKLASSPSAFELGELVQVTHSRFGWSAGSLYRVVGVDEGATTIRIWG